MNRLEKVLTQGIGEELDEFGKLVDTPRKGYGPDRGEPDQYYRERLRNVPLMKLLTHWLQPADAD
jgi:hypothetical protein